MNAKSQKRLVGKREYRQIIGDNVAWFGMGVICLGVGAFMLLVSLPQYNVIRIGQAALPDYILLSLAGASSLFFLITGLLLIMGVPSMIADLKNVKVTSSVDTGRRPDVETLVRASELPPSQQQAELLRAAGEGPETPAEELLRAGPERSICLSASNGDRERKIERTTCCDKRLE